MVDNNKSPRLGRGVRQLEHGGHVYQGLAHFAVRAAHKTQRNRELEEKPVDQDQVADRRLTGNFAKIVGEKKVSTHGQKKGAKHKSQFAREGSRWC